MPYDIILFTYTVMEGYFITKFVLFGHKLSKNVHVDKIHVQHVQGRIFCRKKTCGNAPQHRTGLVKLTISLLFGTIGDYLILIGDYSRLIGDYSK